jgi:hypothetical protein
VDEDAPEPRYSVAETDRAEQDRERAYLRLNAYSPRYAGDWLNGLLLVFANLPRFPGPRSHAIDAAASD